MSPNGSGRKSRQPSRFGFEGRRKRRACRIQRRGQVHHYEADTRADYPDRRRSDAFGRTYRQQSRGAASQPNRLPARNRCAAPLADRHRNAGFYAKLKKQPLTQNRGLLERVGISQAAHRRVGTYSKGMRQRLALAQALLGEPKVLLFDEPTIGLDPASRQMFYEVVRELNGRGATVLLSTHALAVVGRSRRPHYRGLNLIHYMRCMCGV